VDWKIDTRAPKLKAELRAELEAVKALREKSRIKTLLLKDLEPDPLHPVVIEQMARAIGAAVALAEGMGGEATLFYASILGHHDEIHPEGILERVTVHVDVAPGPAPAETIASSAKARAGAPRAPEKR
jgi:hypothetical protein